MKQKKQSACIGLFGAAFMLFSLLSCEGRAAEYQRTGIVGFTLGHLNSTAHLLAFVAKEEGFFTEEGLAVTLKQASSSRELLDGLENKSLDAVFLGSIPTVTFQSQGHSISVFGGAMSNGHGMVINPAYTEGLSQWDASILRGRKIGSVENSMQDFELLYMLEKAGINKDRDVDIVYFAGQGAAYNAFISGDVDALPVYSPYLSMAQGMGYDVVFYCADEDDFAGQPCCRQVALTQSLADKPEVYEAFERAIIKAYRFSLTNQTRTLADVSKYIDIKREYIEFEVYGGLGVSKPDPDKASTLRLKNHAVDLGYAKDYAIDRLYNTSIYQSALDDLAKAYPEDVLYHQMQTYFTEHE